MRPEDALEAARREVKQWRMEQLATVKRQHHLDALTEWYVLAWDAFRAPRFPAPSPVGFLAFSKRRASASAPGVVGEAPTTAPGAGALPADSATG